MNIYEYNLKMMSPKLIFNPINFSHDGSMIQNY